MGTDAPDPALSAPESAGTIAPSNPLRPWPNLFYLALGGAIYGVLMRLSFGMRLFGSPTVAGYASGAMLTSFLFLVPALIGALTVFRTPESQRGWGGALILPLLPTLLFVAGAAVLLIEGSICIIMALPIFLFMASFGGFVMWVVLRFFVPSRTTVGALLLLPLATGAFERHIPLPPAIQVSDASVHIRATPTAIWQLINRATAISPDEMQEGWAFRIGVPHPIEAVTVETDNGRVRKLRWEQGVHFDEPILDWDENRYIRWRYEFAPDSIPPGALDEHVTIGGRYFDLIDTSYRLDPEGDGTRLSIHVSYRVSTGFNWYAAWFARLLVDNSAQTILAFYQHRSEAMPSG